MITNELTDYIKVQLADGVSKETIIENLKAAGGWTTHSIDEAFASLGPLPLGHGAGIHTEESAENKIWTKRISSSNKFTLYLSLPLVFGLDLWILYTAPSLFAFWAMMFGVFVGFCVFFYFENYYLRQKFQHTKSTLDYSIFTLVSIRNLVVIISCIPVIQLVGLAILAYGGIPYLVIYALLVYFRFKKLSAETSNAINT